MVPILGGIIAVGFIGFGLWWFVLRTPENGGVSMGEIPRANPGSTGDGDNDGEGNGENTQTGDGQTGDTTPRLSSAELQQKAISRMISDSRISE